MREIKFRGLMNNGSWVYGSLLKGIDYCLIECEADDLRLPIVHSIVFTKRGDIPIIASKVIPETVGQYTGLNDNNGVEIYIGDVYVYLQPLVEKGRQIYKAHQVVVKDEIPELFYLKNRSECSRGGVAVIGNIHQNPELLEKKNS